MKSLRGHSCPQEYLDDQFTYQHADVHSRVLKSQVVGGRTYYAAVEHTGPAREREVFAAVCLIEYNLRDPEGYIFGYKDMTEHMGPCQSECPAAILDLLTPTESPYAREWRERCRAAASTVSS